jgi:hypothetical protein
MNPKFKLINSAGEVLITLLLYYWWHWDLHYILLFFYIDTFAGLTMSLLKERKIKHTQNVKQHLLLNSAAYITLAFLGVGLYEFGTTLLYPEMHLWQSILGFVQEKEFGISQLFLLLPALFLVNYQQYKTFFIKTQEFRVVPLQLIQTTHQFTWLLFMASGLVYTLCALIFQRPIDFFLFIIIGTKLINDLVLIPRIERSALRKLLNSHHVHTR